MSQALDLFETLANRHGESISLQDIRQDIRNIHTLILKGIDDQNAGKYRAVFVKISGSRYTLPDPAKILGMMQDFGQWLETISQTNQTDDLLPPIDPVVAACAAHAWFVYIHPFIDGNGRTARLLMNLLLLKRGYPITIITKDDRNRYYDALEESQASNLTPFIGLVLEAALESIEVYEQAAQAQLDLQQFVQDLVDENTTRLKNEYEVFESAMRLIKGYFRQTVQLLDEKSIEMVTNTRVGFKDFGGLEFEKYQSLRLSQSAKKTWFFRLTLYNEHDQAKIPTRYLFFFGVASREMAKVPGASQVTLHLATETYPYNYERLSKLDDEGLPAILEISYLAQEESFVALDRDGNATPMRAEGIAQLFIQQALKHFS